jgi:putative peptide zinc metalloprotease protein
VSTTSLFSPSWYRVSNLRPRLRSHAQIHRHFYRGQLWYVVQNHSTGRFHRFSPEAYLIIGLMDGKLSLNEIWETAAERLGDDMPTQEEVINLLTQLHRADVLQSDSIPATEELQLRDNKQIRKKRLQTLRSPLAIRIPLLDPEKFLHGLSSLIAPLFSGFGLLLWLVVVGWAVFLAAGHWSALTDNISDRVLAMDNLLLLWITFPFVKALHELGHGFAVKRWGGEVHEMGIMFLVFMPVPYVDASAASAFQSKYQRMVVGSAGMLVEVFIAALAMFVWLNVEPGMVRAVAFNVMLIAGVSTVLFNGNPLLRFDGYYVLMDWLEIPNLGSRANQYIGYLIQRYPFGIRNAQSPVSARGERGWFVFYSIASFCYRMFIFATIIWFVAGEFFVIGVLLAIWAATTTLIVPFMKQIWFLLSSPKLSKQRGRAMLASGVFVSMILTALLMIPVPSGAIVEGVIWAPEKSQVRASAAGLITRLAVQPGQAVSEADILVECEEPGLPAEVRVLQAQLKELRARYDVEILKDKTQAQITQQDIGHVQGMLARAEERQQELIVRSPTEGIFVVSDPQDMPGRFVQRGEVIGYVMDYNTVTARIVVVQEDVDLVRKHLRDVQVRLADRLTRPIPAVVEREVPAATDELPSPALSIAGGGVIATRPNEKGADIALRKLFQFDVKLHTNFPVNNIGERVYVRLLRDPEPLALQWFRLGRQLFLSKFNV